MHYWNGHIGWMWFWWILVLLLLGVVVWAAIRGLQTGGRKDGPERPGSRPDPEDLLKERYARGEIDRDTYLRQLEDLRR